MASTTWKRFEIKCAEYLNKKFGRFASFVHKGGPNSTVSDILVNTKSGKRFFIDAKHSPAQCGQFVLKPNPSTKSFIYSPENRTPINQNSEKIIEHMNALFTEFEKPGTKGKNIIMSNYNEIFPNWIIDAYKHKNVLYIITNNYIIFPIEQFGKYFEVSAKYRIKRSGSSNDGKRRMLDVCEYILHRYDITSIREEKDKLFVTSTELLDNCHFSLNEHEYMFSRRGLEYEIRKLSKTLNANVIFSINLRQNTGGISENDFIQALK